MSGTLALDTLTSHAHHAGAKVLLVGDWAQLSAVESGGEFRMLATDRADAPELSTVRRFHHRWDVLTNGSDETLMWWATDMLTVQHTQILQMEQMLADLT